MAKTKMDEAVELTLNSLKYNRFRAQYARTASEARQIVLELIPLEAVIGAGDSATLRQIGVLEALEARGNKLINPMTKELTLNTKRRKFRERLLRRSLHTDVYLSGSNAITQDGKLVNIDRVGNRVCGMVIGAPKVIVVVGRNKIVPNVDEALCRIKEVLAPAHTSWKQRNTPCAVTGECSECNSQDRICRVTVILEKRPHLTDMTIVLVDEDLGLGWDPTWPQSRIETIRAKYQEVTWSFPPGPEAGP